MESHRQELPEQAHQATKLGDWNRAYELFLKADTLTPLAGEDLAVLARVAYATGHLDVTITAWERLYMLGLRQGDRLTSAMAAVQTAMHLLFDTALIAPVRGWLRRADDLLEGSDKTPAHAWLAVVRNYERLLSGDFVEARRWAQMAVEIGTRLEPSAAAIGRVAEARTYILEGEVELGLQLLDEAGVSLMAGEIDPLASGVVYCEMVCGLQGLAQYDLAEQWTEAMELWHHGQPVGSVHGRCRVHRAEILRLRGQYEAAEREAMLAYEELRPYLRRELGWPLNELGRIRLRKGDLEGAEQAFLEAEASGWEAQHGLALVHRARSQPDLAATYIRNALDNPSMVPSKELPPASELRRAPLLETQVAVESEAGDLERARAAAEELTQIAAKFGSKALAASAAYARGRLALAEGDGTAACRELEQADQLWNEVGAPYEAATTRLWLGEACRARGEEGLAIQRFQTAEAMFRQLGATGEVERVVRVLAERSASASSSAGSDLQRSRPAGIFRREGDYWSITFQGGSTRIRDLKGMHHLAKLLAQPGKEIHVLDLVRGETGYEVAAMSDPKNEGSGMGLEGSELLDDQAKQSYRRRLHEIDEDIEDAEAMNDAERAVQARVERDFLVRELARAVGFGGRDRRAGAVSERARVSVTRALRAAMSRIQDRHPLLGEHLARSIQTGTYCAYLPDTRLTSAWRTE